jgi:hypothetical protein
MTELMPLLLETNRGRRGALSGVSSGRCTPLLTLRHYTTHQTQKEVKEKYNKLGVNMSGLI